MWGRSNKSISLYPTLNHEKHLIPSHKIMVDYQVFPIWGYFHQLSTIARSIISITSTFMYFPLVYLYIYIYDFKIDQVNVCFWPPKLMFHDMIAWMNSQEDVVLLGKYWQKWSQLVTSKDPCMVYLPTWMVDLYGKCLCIYTIHGSYGTYDFVGRCRSGKYPSPMDHSYLGYVRITSIINSQAAEPRLRC